MEQDWKKNLKADILEDMKKEAIREWTEEKAKIYLETTNYDDERISERFGVPLYRVQKFREEHEKLEFAKQLEITEEPAYIEDEIWFLSVYQKTWIKKGKTGWGRKYADAWFTRCRIKTILRTYLR